MTTSALLPFLSDVYWRYHMIRGAAMLKATNPKYKNDDFDEVQLPGLKIVFDPEKYDYEYFVEGRKIEPENKDEVYRHIRKMMNVSKN